MRAADEFFLGFTAAVRAAGVAVTHDRASTYLQAVAALDAGDLTAVRAAGRATLCGSREDASRHDAVFAAWFAGAGSSVRRSVGAEHASAPFGGGDGGERDAGYEDLAVAASEIEILRRRDIAAMTESERARLDTLIRTLRPRPPVRRTARRTSWRRGEVDLHRTLRGWLRHQGEPIGLWHRRRGIRPRRVVLLIDISASMRPYADALLRLAHLIARSPGSQVEVFTLGTRLTRVTAALRSTDPHRAVAQAGHEVPDWAGGTRLGATLRTFIANWQSVARGAVVVLLSDGWERGATDNLAAQTDRLHRLAHRVVWVNPHRGKDGYEPVQRGIIAVLPHVDDLVAGHCVDAFAEVLEVVGRA